MYKYKCLNPIAAVGTALFDENYERTEELSEANVVLVRSADMKELELPEGLLAIARAGAGVNNIPVERCAEEGIVVFNAPGANANGVKEIVLAGMLLASRDLVGGINWVRENSEEEDIAKKTEKQKKNYAGTEIKGKTLGVIGLGAVGALVANAALDLGMKVIGYDPYISIDGAWHIDHHVDRINDLDDILTRSDFITLHVPALESTKKMINREAISKMKDGVVVLNYARDLLVDEEAMAEALARGHVRCYASDFPNPVSAGMKNAIVTPHLGASTEEAEDNCAIMAVRELRQFVENGNILNSVNFPRTDLGPIRSDARISIFHQNIAGMIGKITTILSGEGVNIENMSDQSRGAHAYSLLDVTGEITDGILAKLRAIDGVTRVRLIKK